MSDPEATSTRDDERAVIRAGRDFEQEYRLDASEAGEFLIELELPGRTDEKAPNVE